MIKRFLNRGRERSYKSCEELLEDCLTVKDSKDGKLAVYNMFISRDEKPVKELAEKYEDHLDVFLDRSLDDSEREDIMNYMVGESEVEDKLYFLSHRVNI